jgi:hypothetical protein
MSTDKKLFTIAGTSIHNGEMSVRVATGKISVREGVLRRNEHTEIKLFELPNPMTRAAAAAYIETLNGEFPLPAPKEPKVKKEKVAKEPKVKKEKVVKEPAAEVAVEVPAEAEDKAAAARERKNAARRAQRAAAKEAKEAEAIAA